MLLSPGNNVYSIVLHGYNQTMDEELGDHTKMLLTQSTAAIKNTMTSFFSLYCCRPDEYPVNRRHTDFQ